MQLKWDVFFFLWVFLLNSVTGYYCTRRAGSDVPVP